VHYKSYVKYFKDSGIRYSLTIIKLIKLNIHTTILIQDIFTKITNGMPNKIILKISKIRSNMIQ